MSLPKLLAPEFGAKIPSTGQEIRYRPFLVKEEKILLMAMEGNDQKEITKSVVKLLDSCILTDGIDASKLATFDVEYLFLKLRGKSVGEVVNLKIGHPDESECSHKSDIQINLDDIVVEGEMRKNVIKITDDIGVKVRYPSLSDLSDIDTENQADLMRIIVRCIDQVFDEENVYSDFSEDEMSEWVDGLSQQQFQEITKFFEDMPKLSHEVKWTCKECGKEDSVRLEGLQSFF